jgi:hypothetical protein
VGLDRLWPSVNAGTNWLGLCAKDAHHILLGWVDEWHTPSGVAAHTRVKPGTVLSQHALGRGMTVADASGWKGMKVPGAEGPFAGH